MSTVRDPGDLDARLQRLQARYLNLRNYGLSFGLGLATLVALGLPFLWDHSDRTISSDDESSSVTGWGLPFYDPHADNLSLSVAVRWVPVYLVVAAVATSVGTAVRWARLAVAIDLVVLGALVVALYKANNSTDAITGAAGAWVLLLLALGWLALALFKTERGYRRFDSVEDE